jgi:hypothetical protein
VGSPFLHKSAYTPAVATNLQHFLGVVIAWVCILLFWLGVNVLDGWVQRKVYPPIRLWWARLKASAREKVRGRHRRQSAGQLRGP